MTNNTSESFIDSAQRNTRIVIGGAIVNPAEIGLDLEQAGELSIEIHIGRAALCHELNEAGVPVSQDELEEFVGGDLAENPQAAVAGYLGIARGILLPSRAKGLFAMFAKKEKTPMVKWHVTRVKDVVTVGDSIVLRGNARALADKSE
ncbi:hypothetical protein [Luteolibacter luteus]|uniref:Uncharacterized protein n=1 Tax=Luteolibacter luteus TaxID=2728835 RepID=A0A858RHL6_9BACT|nr:hypothetical protein [Luteolibacter luteus]QJE95750.1 hypothetical protein HHL09_08115 [Luteolibacter luteus]